MCETYLLVGFIAGAVTMTLVSALHAWWRAWLERLDE